MDEGFPWGILVPILITAIIIFGIVLSEWIKIKHGYPVDGEGGKSLEDQRAVTLLTDENGKLQSKVLRLEERVAVLEKIATDPAERTAREIETLRSN